MHQSNLCAAGRRRRRNLPRSNESKVSDVSVAVTFVTSVDADSVDVFMVASADVVDVVDDDPITTT